MNTTLNQTETWDRNAWLTFRKHVGKNLKACRKAQDLTLEDLAEVSGYSVETILKFERGKGAPNLPMIFHLTRILKIPTDMIFRV